MRWLSLCRRRFGHHICDGVFFYVIVANLVFCERAVTYISLSEWPEKHRKANTARNILPLSNSKHTDRPRDRTSWWLRVYDVLQGRFICRAAENESHIYERRPLNDECLWRRARALTHEWCVRGASRDIANARAPRKNSLGTTCVRSGWKCGHQHQV